MDSWRLHPQLPNKQCHKMNNLPMVISWLRFSLMLLRLPRKGQFHPCWCWYRWATWNEWFCGQSWFCPHNIGKWGAMWQSYKSIVRVGHNFTYLITIKTSTGDRHSKLTSNSWEPRPQRYSYLDEMSTAVSSAGETPLMRTMGLVLVNSPLSPISLSVSPRKKEQKIRPSVLTSST